MSITENLKAKIDQLDLDRRVDEAVVQAQAALNQLHDKAGDLAHQHGEQVERFLDKVTTEIDTRTDGKYAEKVASVREQVSTSVTKLAERSTPDSGNPDSGNPSDPTP